MARGARVGCVVSAGYVVRGKDKRGNVVTGDGITTIEAAVRAMRTIAGCSDVAIFRVLDDGREERLPSYEEALALLDGATSSDAYLANVSTQLLATMRENDRLRAIEPADPIAALEAAERRLLEAGGWHLCSTSAGFGVERWRRASAPDAHESRTVALTIERRRLAAKGGV